MNRLSSAATTAPASSARSTIVQVIVTTLVTLVVVIGAAAGGLLLVHHQVTVMTTTVTPAIAANRTVRQSLTDVETGIRGFQLTGNRQFLQPYEQAKQPLADAFAALDLAATDDPPLADLVRRQHETATIWLEQYGRPAVDGRGTSLASQQAAKAAFDSYRAANTEVGDALRARNNASLARSTLLIWVSLGVLVTLAAVGLLLILVPALRMLRLIGPPLEDLQRTVARLRAGDLSARVDSRVGVVEIQAVSAAVNELAAEHQHRRERDAENLRLAASVRDLSVQIGSSLDLDHVVRTGAEGLTEHFGADAAWVRIFGDADTGGNPGLGVRHPAVPDGSPPTNRLLAAGRRMGEVAWQRQTYYLLDRDETADPEFVTQEDADAIFAVPTESTAQHILFVPIGVGPQCLGYLGLSRSANRPRWGISEVDALLGVGRDLGRATLHARLFERESYLVAELQEIDGRKSDFVSMVSHELRTPLASIIGHLEIVQSGDLGVVDPDMEPSLGAIDRNAVRLTTLIEDLLLLSRIEQRAQPAKLHPLDLVAVAEDVVELHRDPAEHRGIHIELDRVEPAPVLGDELELERVLGNLLSNAIKYSATDSTVGLQVEVVDDQVVTRIRDHGIGVSSRDQAQLFQRFFRSANPAAQSVPGTGLGLAITKLIVEKHGGTIEVDSELGLGSTFTVTLPRLVGTVADGVTRHRSSRPARVG